MRGSQNQLNGIKEKTFGGKHYPISDEFIIIRKFKNDDTIEKESYNSSRLRRDEDISFENGSYIERLYSRSVDDIYQSDKRIVAEAFRRNNVLIERRTITIWQFIKFLFGKYEPYKSMVKTSKKEKTQ